MNAWHYLPTIDQTNNNQTNNNQPQTTIKKMTQTNNEKITLELTLAELFELQAAISDSSSYWYRLWRDCSEGKRSDLHSEGCWAVVEKRHEMFKKLENTKNKK
jgi:hypothetical protein